MSIISPIYLALFIYCSFLQLGNCQLDLTNFYQSDLTLDGLAFTRDIIIDSKNVNPKSTNLKHDILSEHAFRPEDLPIFCKIEYNISRTSKVNIRMRLGSLDYVNYLEGK